MTLGKILPGLEDQVEIGLIKITLFLTDAPHVVRSLSEYILLIALFLLQLLFLLQHASRRSTSYHSFPHLRPLVTARLDTVSNSLLFAHYLPSVLFVLLKS